MSSSPEPRSIDTRQGFAAACHAAVDQALAQRARQMSWVDADFGGWPLDDVTILQRLIDWLRLPQRRLTLLTAQPETLRSRPRFMDVYRLWSHAIAVREPAPDDAAELPSLLLVEGAMLVQLMDKRHWRGRCSAEPPELQAGRERIDALLQRSAPALPLTTLGI